MLLKTENKLFALTLLEQASARLIKDGYTPISFSETEEGFEVTIPNNNFGTFVGTMKDGICRSFGKQIDWEKVQATTVCAECGRKITKNFYVFEKDGNIIVVGSGCAKKLYPGYLDILSDLFREAREEPNGNTYKALVSVKSLIRASHTIITKKGFVPSTRQDSTKSEVIRFHGNFLDNEQLAEDIIKYYKELNSTSDFESTCKIIACKELVDLYKTAGIVSAMVINYLKKDSEPKSKSVDLAKEFIEKKEPFEATVTKVYQKIYYVNSWVSASTTEFTLTLENGLNVVFSSSAKKFQKFKESDKIKVTDYDIKNVYKNLVVIGKVKI